MWTGEEVGYQGAMQYQKDHSENEKDEFNFFMESDSGTYDPTGMDLTGNEDAICVFTEVMKLMAPLNATLVTTPSFSLSDMDLWADRGYPAAGLLNHNENYFWYHHSAGDSMLQEDPKSLDKCTALFAAVAYVVADLSINMPRTLTN